MKESDYINTSNLIRIRQIKDLFRELLVLDENAKHEDLIKPMVEGVYELEEQFNKLIKITG